MAIGYVIALTINGNTRYVQDPGWDGGWYTHRRDSAKVYKLARNAEKRIAAHDWSAYSPTVVPLSEDDALGTDLADRYADEIAEHDRMLDERYA